METNMFGQMLSLLILLAVITLILVTNLLAIRPVSSYPDPKRWPFVSVLIPARNEETNIRACVESLLCQDYPGFEVLVLDDLSTDRTAEILMELASENPRLSVLPGKALPAGWMGKHWACHNLAEQARGEVLLFSDADTVYQPGALRQLAAAWAGEQADLLAVIPHEKVVTPGEQIFVPFFLWAILSFLPVRLAYWLPIPALSFAVGQCMLFRREAYRQVGGHAAVRDDVADDVALARRIKTAGLRWRLANGLDAVSCRMYTNWNEAVEGFSKNSFGAFDYNVTMFVLAWVGLMIPFLEPVIYLLLLAFGNPLPERAAFLAAACVMLALFEWLVFCVQMRFPLFLAFYFPIIISLYALVAFRSLLLTLRGGATWKDRKLAGRKIRWI